MQGPFSPFQKPVVVLQSPALGSDPTCLVLITSLSFHPWVTPISQLLSQACNHTKSNGQNTSQSFWFHQFIFSYSLQSVIELFWTSLPPGPHIFCFQICHFILCIPQIQYSFSFLTATNICILSQQYLLHPPLHYHFNQVPSIHTLMRSFSSPVILNIWLFSYIPLYLSISSCLNLLSYTLHTSLLCWPLSSFFHGTLTHLTL